MQNKVIYTYLYKLFYIYLLFLYTYAIDIEGDTNASFEILKIFKFSNIRKFSVEPYSCLSSYPMSIELNEQNILIAIGFLSNNISFISNLI